MTQITPASTFEALHQAAMDSVGTRLFTVMILDPAHEWGCRAYTSHPDEYPVSGSKPLNRNRWFEQVIERHETFVANTTDEFSDVFGDHAIINQLGCQAVINVPVLDMGEVKGTVNFLDQAHHFTPATVSTLEQLVHQHHRDLIQAMAPASWTRPGSG